MHLRFCCISFCSRNPVRKVMKALGADTSNRMYSDVQCMYAYVFFPAPNEANQDGKSASITAPNGPSQELVGWNIHCDVVHVWYQYDLYSDIVTCECIYYVDYVEHMNDILCHVMYTSTVNSSCRQHLGNPTDLLFPQEKCIKACFREAAVAHWLPGGRKRGSE